MGMSQVDPEPTLALSLETEDWSLTTLREKLIKIGAKADNRSPCVEGLLRVQAV